MPNIFKSVYLKLVKINDSPGKIALGLGIGVFSGIMPMVGPLAAIFLATICKANRASALLGALFTNTWLSFIILPLSIKAGSLTLGLNRQEVYNNWTLFLRDFRWLNLFKFAVLKIICPVVLGYIIVAICAGLLIYLLSLPLLIFFKKTHPIKGAS
jgi:uncharacterized protein (DUF2062 family)